MTFTMARRAVQLLTAAALVYAVVAFWFWWPVSLLLGLGGAALCVITDLHLMCEQHARRQSSPFGPVQKWGLRPGAKTGGPPVTSWIWAPILIAAGILIPGLTAAPAHASPETDYLDQLNAAGLVIHDTSAALATGHAICVAFNATTGDVVARNLFASTSWADVPNMATANTIVVTAGMTLCPWHFHPERVDQGSVVA